jgi:7,8-dihydroneopterin aldolase/epimerase/oxygenase
MTGLAQRQDQITISGVKIYPRIGVTADERASAQECEVDLTIWGDFEAAASTDSLEKSMDYTRVLSAMQQVSAVQEYRLVETLAYRIVRNVSQNFPVSRVRIKIRKRPASLRGQIDFVEVAIELP